MSGGSRFGNQEIADFSEIFLGNFYSTGLRSENCGNFGRMERCHSNYTKLINFVISKWCQFQSTASLGQFNLSNVTRTTKKKCGVAMTTDSSRHRYWDDVMGSKIANSNLEMTQFWTTLAFVDFIYFVKT